MKFYIPTYEEVQEIVRLNPNPLFYETINYIDGYKILSYNYRFATYENFNKPVADKIYLDAKELRGLSFVFNEDGSLYKRYLCLRKFWNINQVEETLYSNIKDYKIKFITNKEDGSLIHFIKLPNDKIIAKTKLGFDNEQTVIANKIFNENENYKKFISNLLDNDIAAFFEYTSYKNKIVLQYDEDELTLIKMRDNATGEYLNLNDFDTTNIKVVNNENYTLEQLLELSKTLTNKEGWVIEFENGLMVKQKTDDYFSLHRMLTEDLNRENDIIEMYLKNTLDDAVSQLDPVFNKFKLDWINDITTKLNKYMSDTLIKMSNYKNEFDSMISEYMKTDISDNEVFKIKYERTDKKIDYATYVATNLVTKDLYFKYGKCSDYHYVVASYKYEDYMKYIVEYLLKMTYRLESAKKFLSEIV